MIKIVFVCLGNICRSPMAEAIMKRLVREHHLESNFLIESRATSIEESGNSVYPLAQEKLREKGIIDFFHKSQGFDKEEYDFFDYIIGMDDSNIQSLIRIVGSDQNKKIRKLIPNHEIADPWYTRNFEVAYQEIQSGCELFLEELIKREGD